MDPKAPFSDAEMADIRKYFEANLNIQGSGMVVAAPDHNTGPGGDYYFAWTRDGALSMNALLMTSKLSDIEDKMDAWVAWVERSYQQPDPNQGYIVMTEPKFTIPDGKVFTKGWCRPQTDGPGLRAITLMAYAAAKPSIAQRTWNLVKQELDWIVSSYASDGCDLWEEVTSDDFFWGRYTMRKALTQGSEFAKSSGNDQGRADSYAAKAKEITGTLSGHVNPDGFVFEAKNREVDTAVIEAFNVGDMGDGMFAPLDKEVIQTLATLAHAFCMSFQVNRDAANAGNPGILFGRYTGDSYAGGNPWILLSASAATLLYRQSQALKGGATIDPEAEKVLEGLLGQSVTPSSLLGGGDAIFSLMRKFLTNGMHMNEQIDRNTGKLLSAKDLTWNYANVLKAMLARGAAAAAVATEVVV